MGKWEAKTAIWAMLLLWTEVTVPEDALVAIKEGSHAGLFARVIDVPFEDKYIPVRLLINDQVGMKSTVSSLFFVIHIKVSFLNY